MITKRIARPKDISNDSIIPIIELYFAGRYKTTSTSNSKKVNIIQAQTVY